jgi:hypothetical protein
VEGRDAGAAVGVAEGVEEIARLCQRILQLGSHLLPTNHVGN